MKPLEGLTVLDLTGLLPGPLTSKLMLSLGAKVIKVEHPEKRDGLYYLPPFKQQGSLYSILNDGKEIVFIDLKSKEGKQTLHELIEKCDILLEGFSPDTAEKLGVNYERVQSINNQVIYCSIHGFSEAHPMGKKGSHDINYLAHSGLLDLNRDQKGHPTLPQFQMADVAGGSFPALSSVLCGVIQREKTKKGLKIKIHMGESLHLVSLIPSLFQSNEPSTNPLSGEFPFYGLYQTQDQEFLALGAYEPHFYEAFLKTLGLDELLGTHGLKEWEGQLIKDIIQAKIKEKSLKEWLQIFEHVDCCLSPVEKSRYHSPTLPFSFDD